MAQGIEEDVPLPTRQCPGPREWGLLTGKSLLSVVYPIEMVLVTGIYHQELKTGTAVDGLDECVAKPDGVVPQGCFDGMS